MRTGVVFPARAPVEGLPSYARRVEQLGLDELWVVEDCFLSGGLAMAATALAHTRELRVGVGLVPATVRNPAIVAMEIATLARLHPGRLTITFGHGVAAWMGQIDARPPKRLAALEEVVVAVRALLAGETVTADGTHVRLDGVVLERPPDVVPPILVGSTGPKGLALAGRSADGFLLPEGCGPPFVTWAREQARAGAPQPNGAAVCVTYAWLRIDDDDEAARRAVTGSIEHWLDEGFYPEPYRHAGVRSPPDPGVPLLQLARDVAVAGDPAACAHAIRAFADAGVQTLVLAPVGQDPEGQVVRLAGDVRPATEASAGR